MFPASDVAIKAQCYEHSVAVPRWVTRQCSSYSNNAFASSGNVQEKTIKSHAASNSEVIFYSYGIGSVYLVAILTLSGNLWPGIEAFSSTRFHKISYTCNFVDEIYKL